MNGEVETDLVLDDSELTEMRRHYEALAATAPQGSAPKSADSEPHSPRDDAAAQERP